MAGTKRCARKRTTNHGDAKEAQEAVSENDELEYKSDHKIIQAESETTVKPVKDAQTRISGDSATDGKHLDKLGVPVTEEQADKSKATHKLVASPMTPNAGGLKHETDPAEPSIQNSDYSLQTINGTSNLESSSTSSITQNSSHTHERLRAQISRVESAISQTESQIDHTLQELQSFLNTKQQQHHEHCSLASIISETDTRNHHAPQPPRSKTSEQNEPQEKANSILANHVKQLTKYNEIKDIAMYLLGIIAENEGKQLSQVMSEREVSPDSE